MDISGPGCNPVAAEAQTPQPSKPLPATQTAASEEEQDNTTNTQRRNPRRSDLKRYYTIGEIPFTEKKSDILLTKAGFDCLFGVYFFCLIVPGYRVYKCSQWAISYHILILISNCSKELTCFIYLNYFLLIYFFKYIYIFHKKKYWRKHKKIERNALGKNIILTMECIGILAEIV